MLAIKKELQRQFDPTAAEEFQENLKKPPRAQSKSAWLKQELNDLLKKNQIVMCRHKELGNTKIDDGIFHWGRIACFLTNKQEIMDDYELKREQVEDNKKDDEQYIWDLVKTPGHYLPCKINKIKCVICQGWKDYTIANFKSHLSSMSKNIYNISLFSIDHILFIPYIILIHLSSIYICFLVICMIYYILPTNTILYTQLTLIGSRLSPQWKINIELVNTQNGRSVNY